MEPPLGYQIDTSRRYVLVTYRRQPAIQEWSATMDTIFTDPMRDPSFGILLDRRRVASPASTEYIRKMVAGIEALNAKHGEVPWALLVSDVASFGVGRMAEQMGRSDAIRAFLELGEAEDWIASFAGH